MSNWGFFECISDEAQVALMNYQWENYGTKIDKPVFHWKPGVSRQVKYPTLEEIDRTIRQKPEHQKRVV